MAIMETTESVREEEAVNPARDQSKGILIAAAEERFPEERASPDEPLPEPPPNEEPKASPAKSVEKTKQDRLLSLDVFRGLTILLMLLVNNIALDTQTPAQLTHAPWNQGVTLADMVFPWFLLCVGVAIPFSAASFRRKNLPDWRYDLKILWRAMALVLLGCLITSSIEKRPVFGLGVLQVIGLAYLVGAFLYDLPISRRGLLAGIFLLGYGFALRAVPVPGLGAGVIEENRNLITHLNQTFLEPVHLKGLLSVIPTAALVLIGTLLGDLLRNRAANPMRTVAYLMVMGVVLTLAGIVWNGSLPYSKALWTPSYILFTGGTGALILGVFNLLIDVHGWNKWCYPFLVFGSNAILAYVGPILMKLWVLQVWQVRTAAGKTESVLDAFLHGSVARLGQVGGGWFYTCTYIAVCWLILWQLYRKRIFLRV